MKTYKHIFLEGPVRIGKSTAIRECLTPYVDRLGGIACRRYVDENGIPKAYGLIRPDDMLIESEYCPKIHGDPDNGILPEDPGIFLIHRQNGSYIDHSVFDTIGVRMLRDSRNSDLILLDEIGGLELLSADFRKELYHILEEGRSCIGVIKSIKSISLRIKTKSAQTRESYNQKLREALRSRFDANIIQYSDAERRTIQDEINVFLKNNIEK